MRIVFYYMVAHDGAWMIAKIAPTFIRKLL